MHHPIKINNISLFFQNKVCFEEFSTEIQYGKRIGIIGQNGSGKSTLLRILQGKLLPSEGTIDIPPNTIFAEVPQIINQYETLSGGERFNRLLTHALSINPNILILDEPTNHLDIYNRKKLMKLLNSLPITLIIVSHDEELLETCTETLWHIHNQKIKPFSGSYKNYILHLKNETKSIEEELAHLKKEEQAIHLSLIKEQERASKSKAKGLKKIENKKWMKSVGNSYAMGAEKSQGKKRASIDNKKTTLSKKLQSLQLPKIIQPKFYIEHSIIKNQPLISIQNGSIGYNENHSLISNIYLSINSTDKIAISGNNGSGKSTLIQAILNNPSIVKKGTWNLPSPSHIGYLDQHYNNLDPTKTVFEYISQFTTKLSYLELRRHLNNFLFSKNEAINTLISHLSGGEKVRLSLAHISLKTPKLLILDEITNNIDLETKQHITQLLQSYPAAYIVISHDVAFLKQLNLKEFYSIDKNTISSSPNLCT